VNTLKEIAPCRKELRVEIPRETVAAEFETVYSELRKHALVPGFRVGQAPRDLLQRYHGSKAREEVLRRLICRSLDEALKRCKELDLVGRPRVTAVKLEEKQPLSYTANIETAPIFPAGRYKGLKLTGPKNEVTEESVNQVLEQLRQTQAVLKPVLEDRPAAAGDFVLADVTEKRPNQPARKQKEVVIHLDLEEDPEGALKGLLGIKAPESRVLTLKEGATLTVEAKGLKVKEVPALDDPFAKTVGAYESLEALKAAIRKDAARHAEETGRRAVEAQALKQLEESWKFEVPPSLVASQAQRNLKERAVELMQQGVPVTEVQAQAPALTDQAQQDALKQIRLFFILRKIAAAENLTATEQEMEEKIRSIAARMQTTVEQVRKDLGARELMEELAWGIIRGKVVELILKEAEVTYGT
jgi:trigger factor